VFLRAKPEELSLISAPNDDFGHARSLRHLGISVSPGLLAMGDQMIELAIVGPSRAAVGRVSRASPVQTAVRNCTRDEGRSFEIGSQVLVSNHCKLLSSKAMVVSVAANVGTNPSG
jgi:hypothetical protein